MSLAYSQAASGAEASMMRALQDSYEAQGFSFVSEPSKADLPSFMGDYVPDAIARKSDLNVAIEIKRGPSDRVERTLRSIRHLFDGQAGWQFHVFYSSGDAASDAALSRPTREAILQGLDETNSLNAAGHHRAALLLAWALLEAALNLRASDGSARPRGAATLLQSLAMEGFVAPDTERRLHSLVALRNRVAHGDLIAAVDDGDVQALMDAVREAIAVEEA